MSKDVTKRVEWERALLYATTRNKLISLRNRHHGEQFLTGQYGTARVLQCPLVLAMCDIDHSERISNEFGRPTGNRVPAEMADMLR